MSWSADAIDAVVEGTVAPLLDDSGFRRRRRHWIRRLESITASVNVQANRFNSSDQASFTINLGIHLHDLFGPPVAAYPKYYDCAISRRIGHLMPDRVDHWWTLEPNESPGPVARSVQSALSRFGLPWLARSADPVELIDDVFERDLWPTSKWHRVAEVLRIDVQARARRSIKRLLDEQHVEHGNVDPAARLHLLSGFVTMAGATLDGSQRAVLVGLLDQRPRSEREKIAQHDLRTALEGTAGPDT